MAQENEKIKGLVELSADKSTVHSMRSIFARLSAKYLFFMAVVYLGVQFGLWEMRYILRPSSNYEPGFAPEFLFTSRNEESYGWIYLILIAYFMTTVFFRMWNKMINPTFPRFKVRDLWIGGFFIFLFTCTEVLMVAQSSK